MTRAKLYRGMFDGKLVSMSVTDMSESLDRSRDFISRHANTAIDKGIEDVVGYVVMKSNTLRRNLGKPVAIKSKRNNAGGIMVTKENKFSVENNALFRMFLLPFNSDICLIREDWQS